MWWFWLHFIWALRREMNNNNNNNNDNDGPTCTKRQLNELNVCWTNIISRELYMHGRGNPYAVAHTIAHCCRLLWWFSFVPVDKLNVLKLAVGWEVVGLCYIDLYFALWHYEHTHTHSHTKIGTHGSLNSHWLARRAYIYSFGQFVRFDRAMQQFLILTADSWPFPLFPIWITHCEWSACFLIENPQIWQGIEMVFPLTRHPEAKCLLFFYILRNSIRSFRTLVWFSFIILRLVFDQNKKSNFWIMNSG